MTPRRILLLMSGLFAFGVVYALYARAFGWLDGLPVLPTKMAIPGDAELRPPSRPTSPTIELLKESFGGNSPEVESINYPTKLTFRNGDSLLVLACGSPPPSGSGPASNRVTLTPFSLAVYGKPRLPHLVQQGETNEITTFHSDKAVLEFDRKIETPADMNSAKLIRMELISDPEEALPDSYEREGKVHITNNQRSIDSNRFLVMKTVGPVFYRDPKFATGPDQLGPDVWTDSPIEIVDRSNLPRKPGSAAATAPATSDEVRTPTTVAAILGGLRLPPPTVTAVGLRVYLDPDDSPKVGQPLPAGKKTQAKKGSAGFSGVRRVELLEKVLLHLWVEGGQGSLVGAGGKSVALPEPPVAASAVSGGLLFGHHAARELGRDLLQVETRGPFAYDAEKNLARFDVLPQADPNLPNDVRVTKVPPRPGVQRLFSQVLEIEFNGPPTGNPPTKSPGDKPATAAPPGGSPRFKQLHAWTYTPGRFLTISSDADQLTAHGQDLVHEQSAERTTLSGTPIYAVQNRNVLTAGVPKNPAVLIIEPAPGVVAAPGQAAPTKRNQATVRGPGRIELFDTTAKANTITAVWQTSMVQIKERFNDRDIDLFTLTDGAKFEDVRADYWLKGNVLKLWLLPGNSGEPSSGADSQQTSRALPHRIQAIGDVTGHSVEMDIEQTDHLNAIFSDSSPPDLGPGPVAPATPTTASPAPTPKGVRDPATPTVAAKEPAKPAKPPMKIRSRTIDTQIVRYPIPKQPLAVGAAPNPNEPSDGGLKYQLEKAYCDGMVSVHQDPEDNKKPRGTDILGSRMIIESQHDGSVLTVFGWDNKPGEVHNEGTSLIGPEIVIDQLHNYATIKGRGSLAMTSSSDFTGAELKAAEPIVIQFRDGMTFKGALKTAVFLGKVSASQGPSWVTCHTMQVGFDRPIFFTQSNRPGAKPATAKGPNAKDDDKPKVDTVDCWPAPDDSADTELEKIVTFNQIDRDPLTGRPTRSQRIVAQQLRLMAQARDPEGGEPYRQVLAYGPGEVRTWAPGSKDDDPTGAVTPAPLQPGQAGKINAQHTTEMKLTIVNFQSRMMAKDKGDVYKEATFFDPTQVVNVPTDYPDMVVERHKLPPRAVLLTCDDRLVVWTYKKGSETHQFMHAYGNASLQNEDYDGWGEVIKSEGNRVTFQGNKLRDARIKSRFKGDDIPGETIVYDRTTRDFTVIKSSGGTLTIPQSRSAVPPVPKK